MNPRNIKNQDGSVTTLIYYTGTNKVFESTTIKNGRNHGRYLKYHQNGQMACTGNYDSVGSKTGEWINYFSDGTPERLENYVDGLLSGKHVLYYPNGQVKEEGNYQICREDDPNPNPYKRVGAFKRHYMDGTPKDVYHYSYDDEGIQTVHTKRYHPNGEKAEEFTTVDSAVEGAYAAYYDNGVKSQEATYSQNRLVGIKRYWNQQGEELVGSRVVELHDRPYTKEELTYNRAVIYDILMTEEEPSLSMDNVLNYIENLFDISQNNAAKGCALTPVAVPVSRQPR